MLDVNLRYSQFLTEKAKRYDEKFCELMFVAMHYYVKSGDAGILNFVRYLFGGGRYQLQVEEFLQSISVHRFDKSSNQYTEEVCLDRRIKVNDRCIVKIKYINNNLDQIFCV